MHIRETPKSPFSNFMKPISMLKNNLSIYYKEVTICMTLNYVLLKYFTITYKYLWQMSYAPDFHIYKLDKKHFYITFLKDNDEKFLAYCLSPTLYCF